MNPSPLPQYEAALQLEAQATAYTLEAGIIFHSIFIGITLGSTSGASSVRSLMIALMFHQANEVRPRPFCLCLTLKSPAFRQAHVEPKCTHAGRLLSCAVIMWPRCYAQSACVR